MAFEFEWDPDKADINKKAYGASFDDAANVLRDALSITIADPDHSHSEKRFIDIGLSDRGQLLVVSYTERMNRIRRSKSTKPCVQFPSCFNSSESAQIAGWHNPTVFNSKRIPIEAEMPKDANHRVRRNEPVEAREIESLRDAVGWEKLENKYDRILANSYTHFTVRENGRLVAFVNVVSDGICDAFLVDLIVHPDFQRHCLGKATVERAVAELTADGIKCIQVTFNPEHEEFYRECGFHIFSAGIIDNDHRDT